MVFNKTEKQERAYLQQVIDLLQKTICNTDVSVKENVDTLGSADRWGWYKDKNPQIQE